jgi:hypothetical protein
MTDKYDHHEHMSLAQDLLFVAAENDDQTMNNTNGFVNGKIPKCNNSHLTMHTFEMRFANDNDMHLFLHEIHNQQCVFAKDRKAHFFQEGNHVCIVRTSCCCEDLLCVIHEYEKNQKIICFSMYTYPNHGRFREQQGGIVIQHLPFFLHLWNWTCQHISCVDHKSSVFSNGSDSVDPIAMVSQRRMETIWLSIVLEMCCDLLLLKKRQYDEDLSISMDELIRWKMDEKVKNVESSVVCRAKEKQVKEILRQCEDCKRLYTLEIHLSGGSYDHPLPGVSLDGSAVSEMFEEQIEIQQQQQQQSMVIDKPFLKKMYDKAFEIKKYLLNNVQDSDDRMLIMERIVHQVCNICGWTRHEEAVYLLVWQNIKYKKQHFSFRHFFIHWCCFCCRSLCCR